MRNYKNGFTIIELMVTLAVFAVVVGVVLPNFNIQILNHRSIALGEDFTTALNFARSEAVKRRARISLCASSDGATCVGAWTDGFMAFVDNATSDDAAAPVLPNTDGITTILRVWQRPDTNAVITAKRGANDINFIRYTGLGTLARITDDPITVEAKFSNCTNDSAQRLTIGLSGLISLTRIPC